MSTKIKVKNILVTLYVETYEEDNLDEIDYKTFEDDFRSLLDNEIRGGWVNTIDVVPAGLATEINIAKAYGE